jgi:hypothetical protein
MGEVSEKTLEKIEKDILQNDLGKARDRLHGLILTYPNELELRKRLGDIYSALRYPSRAGLYWYLEQNKTPEMKLACINFEKSMGNNPIRIAKALKFKGDCEVIKNLELRQVMLQIQNKSEMDLFDETEVYEETWVGKLELLGIILVIIITLFFTLFGVYQFTKWIL